ncbi:MAG: GspE/PulE family protein [Minisyncoccia bacterium]|jgi:type IV pilus assembly protein PilB
MKLASALEVKTAAPVPEHEARISVIALVDDILAEAHRLGASDIHIDPLPHTVRMRLRVDGVLHDTREFPKNIHPEVIARIKVLSRLRTDEHAAGQDGRFRFEVQGECVDVRVSIMPTYHGENAVLRLLCAKAKQYSLADLGFTSRNREKITNAIQKPGGMVLATGPTGSGKTTTLYTLLDLLNSNEVSIVTIEDPIEYAIEGIEQIQVNPRAGLAFANGLRSMLRQDPNIIMVGEIRDAETAAIAVNTALTGHLLLSTLHTNDAATTLPRLLDMGIDAYLVASTINLAIGQRLVRNICAHCKRRMRDGSYKGTGCDECGGSGYKGRVCINEVLVADELLREAIVHKASAAELRSIAIANGMVTMQEDGFAKAKNGETTLEEVLRVVRE